MEGHFKNCEIWTWIRKQVKVPPQPASAAGGQAPGGVLFIRGYKNDHVFPVFIHVTATVARDVLRIRVSDQPACSLRPAEAVTPNSSQRRLPAAHSHARRSGKSQCRRGSAGKFNLKLSAGASCWHHRHCELAWHQLTPPRLRVPVTPVGRRRYGRARGEVSEPGSLSSAATRWCAIWRFCAGRRARMGTQRVPPVASVSSDEAPAAPARRCLRKAAPSGFRHAKRSGAQAAAAAAAAAAWRCR